MICCIYLLELPLLIGIGSIIVVFGCPLEWHYSSVVACHVKSLGRHHIDNMPRICCRILALLCYPLLSGIAV